MRFSPVMPPVCSYLKSQIILGLCLLVFGLPSQAQTALADTNGTNGTSEVSEAPNKPQVKLDNISIIKRLQAQLTGQLIKQARFSADDSRVIYLKSQLNNPDVFDLWQYHIATGQADLLVEATSNNSQTQAVSSIETLDFISNGRAIAFLAGGDIYSYTLATKAIKPLTQTITKEHSLTVSPLSEKVAFVRDNNIFYIDVNSGEEIQLTKPDQAISSSGIGSLISTHYLKRKKNLWWSPNEEHLAFMQTNNWKSNQEATQGSISTSLKILNIKSGAITSVTTAKAQRYILKVQWLSDGQQLAYVWLTKKQQQLGLNLFQLKAKQQRNIITEESLFWLNPQQELLFASNNKSFIWSAERDGQRHLYHYDINGNKLAQLTAGDWSVDQAIHLDETNGWLYFTGRADSPVERHLYKVPLQTKNPEHVVRLSQDAGMHNIITAPSMNNYLDIYSNYSTSQQVNLHNFDGNKVATLSQTNSTDADKATGVGQLLPRYEFGSLLANDNKTMLFYKLAKPAKLVTGKKYPVIVLLPKSPLTQRVQNSWPANTFTSYLVNQGFIVFELDARGSAHRGSAFKFPLYQAIGDHEVSDQLTGINHLTTLSYVDKDNINLYGQHYGGYLALRLLTSEANQSANNSLFARTAIGNSIYIWSRHLLFLNHKWTKNSVSANIDLTKLNNELYIFHAMADEHVNIDQFYLLSQDLQQQGKSFQMMLYPAANEEFADLTLKQHLYQELIEFYTQPQPNRY